MRDLHNRLVRLERGRGIALQGRKLDWGPQLWAAEARLYVRMIHFIDVHALEIPPQVEARRHAVETAWWESDRAGAIRQFFYACQCWARGEYDNPDDQERSRRYLAESIRLAARNPRPPGLPLLPPLAL